MRKSVRQLLALFLLLLFVEKAGLRLWLHDYLHTTAAGTSQFSQKADHYASGVQTVTCDCLDDFTIPMTGTALYLLPDPVIQVYRFLRTDYTSPLYASQIYSGLLRAPPALFL